MLILASRSPRRRILLKQLGLRHRVHPSKVEEKMDPARSPRENAKRIALEKAIDVARHYTKGVVVGADTIVVAGKKVLGKPGTLAEARKMLRSLSGREHIVYTGFALVDADSRKRVVAVERTRVRFRVLGAREIDDYVKSGSPMDKAGAYGIQDDWGAVFVEKVNGCFYNVVGFPISKFYTVYQQFMSEIQKNHRRYDGKEN